MTREYRGNKMSVIAERYECKKTQNMASDIGEAWLGWYIFFCHRAPTRLNESKRLTDMLINLGYD